MTGNLAVFGTIACMWLAAALVPAASARARSEPEDPRIDQAVELRRRLGELDRQLAALLASLTAEQRQEVERRWALEQKPQAADAGAQEAPPAAPATAPTDAVRAQSGEPPATSSPPGSRCGTLEVLDSNGDGVISSADRNWRYLSLWRDDGDGRVESSEVRSLFRHDIRRVSARLYSYTTAKGTEGGVWLEDAVYFDLPGRRGRATLVINAGGMARGGELWLEDGSGMWLADIQALRAGLVWVAVDGSRTPVLCPPR